MRKFIMGALAAAGLGIISSPAHAVTQCTYNVMDVWADTSGIVWLDFSNSAGAVTGIPLLANSPGQAALLSLAITAKTTGRQVLVRFAANNENCSVANTDFVGMYLL